MRKRHLFLSRRKLAHLKRSRVKYKKRFRMNNRVRRR